MSVSCTISGIHRVSKNVPSLACYNFDTRERILIFLVKKCMEWIMKWKVQENFE